MSRAALPFPRRLLVPTAVATAVGLGLGTLGLVVPAAADPPVAGRTEKVTLGAGGGPLPPGTETEDADVSEHGRFVVYESTAPNLVVGDTNGNTDAFVTDRLTRTTRLLNVTPGGVQGNGGSWNPTISDDGRFVAFYSTSSDLVPGDTNGSDDVFVRDLVEGTTERVSVTSTGAQRNASSYDPAISGDGNVVAFVTNGQFVLTDDDERSDIYVHTRSTGTTGRVSLSQLGQTPDADAAHPAIDHDGSVIAFESDATNLVAADTNGQTDVFVRDRNAGTTERVSVTSAEAQGPGQSGAPSLSATGNIVAFHSSSPNLTGDLPDDLQYAVFARDRFFGTTTAVNVGVDGQVTNRAFNPSVSADGKRIAFLSRTTLLIESPGGWNAVCEPYAALRDRESNTTHPVFVRTDGLVCNGKNPAISPDGRYVVGDAFANLFVEGDVDESSADAYIRIMADHTFTDVPSSQQFFEAISWAVDTGVTTGFEDGSFKPTASVTRQAVAAFLFRMDATIFVPPLAPSFTDVPITHPFYEEIEWLVANDLAEGYPDGTFRPGAPITRQAMAAFLWRLADEPAVALGPTPRFTDVGDGHLFRAPIEWMAANGLAGGYADGGFHPADLISRQAAAAFLFRYELVIGT